MSAPLACPAVEVDASDEARPCSPADPTSGGQHKSHSPYMSYKDFLRQHLSQYPEYTWLHTFFSWPQLSNGSTHVTIFDCIDGVLKEQGQYTSATDDFQIALATRPVNAKTRLIITSYDKTWTIDRTVVDKLGLVYDIDPNFFRRHFYYYFICVENFSDSSEWETLHWKKDSIENEFNSLPSQENSQFHFAFTRKYEMMSAFIHTHSETQDQTSKDLSRTADHTTSSQLICCSHTLDQVPSA
jgi:hypothetical protein